MRRFASDPPLWALWLLIRTVAIKTKSAFLAFIFGAPGIYLGPRCTVEGVKHIHFGRNLFATSNLWLVAVDSYCDQAFSPIIEIGDNVSLSSNVHISAIERIVIGNNVLIGSNIYISDHNHGKYKGSGQSMVSEPPAKRKLSPGGPVVIGENVWIGDQVIILGPSTIGDGAIVASQAIVRGDIPPNTIVRGNPAKPFKRFNVETGVWDRL